MRTRSYGKTGPTVVVLHGGPAAVGGAEPIARGLSRRFRVFEPFQRGSGAEPLSVAVHVEDLHGFIQGIGDDIRPALVGESWGAMLALAYASTHPNSIDAVALVGCGTFDKASRDKMNEIIDSRLDDASRERLRSLSHDYLDNAEMLRARQLLIESSYNYDPIPNDEQLELQEPFDATAHSETWNDMLRLQQEGLYPSAFSSIRCPVLMIHGSYDPHPGQMIYADLKAHIPQLEYCELSSCGHSPWREKQARKQFFMVMSNWLLQHCERT